MKRQLKYDTVFESVDYSLEKNFKRLKLWGELFFESRIMFGDACFLNNQHYAMSAISLKVDISLGLI